jgi:hypothetical protein
MKKYTIELTEDQIQVLMFVVMAYGTGGAIDIVKDMNRQMMNQPEEEIQGCTKEDIRNSDDDLSEAEVDIVFERLRDEHDCNKSLNEMIQEFCEAVKERRNV